MPLGSLANQALLRVYQPTTASLGIACGLQPHLDRPKSGYSSHSPHFGKHLEKREVSKNLSLCCTPEGILLYQHRVGSKHLCEFIDLDVN
jgi:hypothetical protein